MKTTFYRSFVAVVLFAAAVLLSQGCKDDPSSPPAPPVVVDTTALVLTTDTPDTVLAAEGESFQLSFLVEKGGVPVDSATIDFYDSVLKQTVHSGPTGASGRFVFLDTLPQQDIQHKTYGFEIVATKGEQHDTIYRYVTIGVDPVPLLLTLTAPAAETTYVQHGRPITFDFLTTHLARPEDSVSVQFSDPLVAVNPVQQNVGKTVGGNGMLTWTDTVAKDVAAGPYAMTFVAGRRDRLPSNPVTKIIYVIGADSVGMGLRARAISSTSIGVSWNSPTTDKGNDTLILMNGAVEVQRMIVKAKTGASATLTGLGPLVVYSISVHAPAAYSETIQWATAMRYGPVRLYDNAHSDAGHPCGIILSSGATEDITSLSPTPQSDLLLAFDTSTPSHVTLSSVSVTALSGHSDGRTTQFGDNYIVTAAGLDDINHRDLSLSFDSTFNAYSIPDNDQVNAIFPVRTADNHYALVELLSQTNNKDYDMENGAAFVDVIVSYQPIANTPYAARGRRIRGAQAPHFLPAH